METYASRPVPPCTTRRRLVLPSETTSIHGLLHGFRSGHHVADITERMPSLANSIGLKKIRLRESIRKAPQDLRPEQLPKLPYRSQNFRGALQQGPGEPNSDYDTCPTSSAAATCSIAGTGTSEFDAVAGANPTRARDSCRRQTVPFVPVRYRCTPGAGRSLWMFAGERHFPGPCRAPCARPSG